MGFKKNIPVLGNTETRWTENIFQSIKFWKRFLAFHFHLNYLTMQRANNCTRNSLVKDYFDVAAYQTSLALIG